MMADLLWSQVAWKWKQDPVNAARYAGRVT